MRCGRATAQRIMEEKRSPHLGGDRVLPESMLAKSDPLPPNRHGVALMS